MIAQIEVEQSGVNQVIQVPFYNGKECNELNIQAVYSPAFNLFNLVIVTDD